MIRRGRALGAPGIAAVACIALALVAVPSARAVIPDASRIARAVAKANKDSQRSKPMLLDVSLTVGEGLEQGEPAATGTLATHPTGLARLELRSRRGFVERHLLQGDAHTASRDGLLLDRPHAFLPPVFLLQATSGAALSAALASFGVSVSEAALGRIGDRDCYVLGGRVPAGPGSEERLLPSLWVDIESYDVLRIATAEGVRFDFGPSEVFEGGIRAPSWISIRGPAQPPARLDIVRVAPANAPAAAFGRDWLSSPQP